MSGRPILVLGASGQVGSAVVSRLSGSLSATRRDFDLAIADEREVVEFIAGLRPSAVVNCAAFTAVDRAEIDSDLAHRVNAVAVGYLARATAAIDAVFVTYSTDYVFSGKAVQPYVESSETAPVNSYGASKLAGERLALELNPASLVIRTSWVISGTHPNFVATVLRRAVEGPLQVVSDQVGCPTIASDLADATIRSIDSGLAGVLHLTNEGACTWFDLASETVRLAGLDPALVEPCSTRDFPTPARRPAYSVLGTERADHPGGMPSWSDSLVGVVEGVLRRRGLGG